MQAHHQEHPHNEEIGDQGHEKKPVMQRMKDKVKKPVIKMKETINKKMHHGHDDGHDDEHREQRERDAEDVKSDEEEEGCDAEEKPGPEVHGAPVYESPATSHLILGGQNENLGPGKVDLREEKPAAATEDPPAAPTSTGDESRLTYPSADKSPEKASLGGIIGTVDEDAAAAPKGKTEIPTSGGEESQAMASSPTAGRDKVGESPLLSSFQSMAITEDPKTPQPSPPADTRDQFSPEKEDDPKEEEKPQQNPPTYTEKLSSVATAAKDAAVSVAATSTEYTKKIASTVLDKASGASTAMMGKGSANETEPNPDKGVSVKEYIVGKTRPGEEDRVLSEVISGAMQSEKQEANLVPETETEVGAMQSKKQEATLVPETETEAKGSAEESGGGGMGMVDKIKGAVSSWIGAGSVAGGKQASTPSESMDLKGKE